MKTITITLSVLATFLESASAVLGNANYVAFDANSSAPRDGYQIFRNADRTPNETHAVGFKFASTNNQNWTWTLKASDVVMPNSTGTNLDTLEPNPPANAHVAYTTYDFSWPQGGSLNDAVSDPINEGSFGPSCMYMIWATFPLNVSAKYDPSSSDCTSALGAACVSAIVSQIRAGQECETNNFPIYSNYQDDCADSFGAIEDGGFATQAYAFGNRSAPSNQTSLQSGQTWAWTISDPYAPDNSTAFETEKERLRVIALTSGGQSKLLCNRVADRVENAAVSAVRIQGLAIVSVVAMIAAVVHAM